MLQTRTRQGYLPVGFVEPLVVLLNDGGQKAIALSIMIFILVCAMRLFPGMLRVGSLDLHVHICKPKRIKTRLCAKLTAYSGSSNLDVKH